MTNRPYLRSRTVVTFTYYPVSSDTEQTVELKGDEAITRHMLYLINNTIHAIERELARAKQQMDNGLAIARLSTMLESERAHSIDTLTTMFDISRFSASFLLDYAVELANVYDEMDIIIENAQRSQE